MFAHGGLVDRSGEGLVDRTRVTDRALVVATGKGHSGHGGDRRGSKCDFDHFQ